MWLIRFVHSPLLQSADRKVTIKTAWQASGRSAEPAGMHWDAVEYDHYFKCAFFEVPQTKVAKLKLIALVAGVDRHSCWLLDMGDFLITAPPLTDRKYQFDEACWMFPSLHTVSNPGEKIGSYIKALQPRDRGGNEEYKGVAVDILPPAPSAAGIRPGACNVLATGMPAEFVVHTTGHELKNAASSLWEYIDAELAKCMPGAIVLAGWPALPWGHLGRGPTPPDLQVLVMISVTIESLQQTIDVLFNLDDASPPMLLAGGELRYLVYDMFATQIMYHEQRVYACEMRTATGRLEDVMRQKYGCTDPRATLFKWGRFIMEKFNSDNGRLTGMTADTGLAQLAESHRHMGQLVAEQRGEIQGMRREVAEMRQENAELHGQLRTLIGMMQNPVEAAEAPSAPTPSAPMPSAPTPSAPTPSAPTPSAPTPASGMGSLLPVAGSQHPVPYTTAKKNALTIFLECMLTGGEVPAGLVCRVEKQRVRLIIEWFSAMATDEELTELKDRGVNSGQRRIMALGINHHVRARLAHEIVSADIDVPPSLAKGKMLGSSTIYSQVARLNPKPTVDREEFLAFRADSSSQASVSVVAEAVDDSEPEVPEDNSDAPPEKRARTSQEGASSSTSPLRRFMGMFNAA